jgi:membrane-bound lytic murein transglycosylase F|tara:strand:+ start:10670 stop:12142 length:1473 start_codon:yes stop_codon:yes gene_type:complete
MFRLVSPITLILIALLLISCDSPPSYFERIHEHGKLIMGTRNGPTTFYIDNQGPTGFEYELGKRFAKSLNLELEIQLFSTEADMWEALDSGHIHFIAYGSPTPDAEGYTFSLGPAYQTISQKLVFKQGTDWPRDAGDLTEPVAIPNHRPFIDSLQEIKKSHPDLTWEIHSNRTTEQLLDLLLEEKIAYTVVNSNELALHRQFTPDVSIAFSLNHDRPLRWHFPHKEDDSLLGAAFDFFSALQSNGELEQLVDRYYGHIKRFDYVDTRAFIDAVDEKLPKYLPLFKEAAEQDIDWRLLASIGYQESHWNPKARSPTGVRGIMMLTRSTAKQVRIKNRLDPKQSIMGGAKYFRYLYKLMPNDIREPDRSFFTLASYNVGWGHVNDARYLTSKAGKDPNKWVHVKEFLPLLRHKKWYSQTKYGYARGDEPVKYVTNIRRYYQILQWLHNDNPNFHQYKQLNDPEMPQPDSTLSELEMPTSLKAGNVLSANSAL